MSLQRRLAAGVILARANFQLFERPDRLARSLLAMAPWGTTLPGVVAAAAARYPDRIAIHDDDGSITYATLWDRSQRIAGALLVRGVGEGSRVGLLCRNHRGFVEWLVAASATGADVVLLNTGFAAPQLAAVVRSEGITAIVHDDEFADIVGEAGVETFDESAMAALARSAVPATPRRRQGRMVILTSGTTGQPKGAARRSDSGAIEGIAAVLERIPFRPGDTQVVAAPLFHGWGLTNLLLGVGRCSTNVLSRRFDAEATLRATSEHRAQVLVVVPVMLSRILALDPEVLVAAPTSDLRVIASSGSALGSRLATAALERFGPVLYNLYGSTEVAVATIAIPIGPARGTLDGGPRGVRGAGRDPRRPRCGRPGWHGGPCLRRQFDAVRRLHHRWEQGGAPRVALVGRPRLLPRRALFVEGREDDMIVSGGENVFPGEVEELLSHHPSVAEVAVIGVADEEFGQVLAAFVVRRRGAKLTADQVRAHVRDHLARHKVPRRVEFIDELPRNSTGKILRRSLAERAAPGAGTSS